MSAGLAIIQTTNTRGIMNASETTGRIIRSHAAGVVLYRFPEPNRLEMAAMHYHRRGETTLRVFMGTQGQVEATGRKKSFNETTHREFKSEALDISVPFKDAREIRSLIYWELASDDMSQERNPKLSRLLHLKGFRAIRMLEGGL